MVVYADTSFLVSLYGRDASSAEAQQMAVTLESPFAFTLLHRHEARNALRLAIFRKDITPNECKAVLAAMGDDEKSGVLANTPFAWAEVFDQAETLSASHTPKLGTRAMDILHVAAAEVLGIREFLTFDTRQKALARKIGMTVRPS
ncbi:MAG: type II toxin-antitoxin system VapC family toxin [Verrucomicrobiales bacterium]